MIAILGCSSDTRTQLGFNGVVAVLLTSLHWAMLLLGLSSHVGPPELLQPFFRGLAGRLSLQRPGPRRHQTTATASVPGPGLSLVRPAAPRSQSEAGMTARDVAALPDTLPGT